MPDWSRLGRSSRNRGHNFERMIANMMNKMFETDRFYRTPCSGGHGIEGDIYEDPTNKTEWGNIEIYCRTQINISLEAFICEKDCQLKRWIRETGKNSMWIFRNRPGRIFVLTHVKRFRRTPDEAYATSGDLVILNFHNLPKLNLYLGEIQ